MGARILVASTMVASLGALGHAEPRMRPLAEVIRVADDPDGCLDHDSLIGEVERWLGKRDVDVPITVEVRGHRKTAAVVIQRDGDEPVTKIFDVLPVVCRGRRNAVGLAIALAIDHTVLDARTNAVDGAAPPPSEPRITEAPEASSPASVSAPMHVGATPPPGLVAADAPAAPKRVSLQLGAGVVAGVLPASAIAGTGGVGVRLTARSSIRMLALVTQEVEAPLPPGSLTTRLAALRGEVCLDRPVRGLVASGCAGLTGGVVTATGHDLEETRTTLRPWGGAQIRLATRFPATATVSVQLALDASVTLLKPRVHVEDDDVNEVVARTFPSIGAGASVELVIDLW